MCALHKLIELMTTGRCPLWWLLRPCQPRRLGLGRECTKNINDPNPRNGKLLQHLLPCPSHIRTHESNLYSTSTHVQISLHNSITIKTCTRALQRGDFSLCTHCKILCLMVRQWQRTSQETSYAACQFFNDGLYCTVWLLVLLSAWTFDVPCMSSSRHVQFLSWTLILCASAFLDTITTTLAHTYIQGYLTAFTRHWYHTLLCVLHISLEAPCIAHMHSL